MMDKGMTKGPRWPRTRLQWVIVCFVCLVAVLVYNHLGLIYYLVVLGLVGAGALVIRRMDRKRRNS